MRATVIKGNSGQVSIISRKFRKQTGESGFITVFVMMTALLIVVLLSGALQASYHLHDQNRCQLEQVRQRVESVTVSKDTR